MISLVMFLTMYLHPIIPVTIVVPEPIVVPVAIVQPKQVSRSTQPSRQFEITAYCLKGKTASGTTVTQGRTIAADWRVLPKGTRVTIEGFEGTFVVEDTGSDIKGSRIDIYMSRYSECINFGRRRLFVTVVK